MEFAVDANLLAAAKVGVLAASTMAAIVGLTYGLFYARRKTGTGLMART